MIVLLNTLPQNIVQSGDRQLHLAILKDGQLLNSQPAKFPTKEAYS